MLSIYFDVAAVGDRVAYERRVAVLAASLRGTPVAPGAPGVMVPGDRTRQARAEAAAHGLPVTAAMQRSLEAAADRAGVSPEARRQWPHPLRAS
jgi:LDH2 family malate/lactate/ureidoglycolate dehydrogenase